MPTQRKRKCEEQPKGKTGEHSQSKYGEHSRSKVNKKDNRESENHEPERLVSPEKVKNKNVVNFLKQSQNGNISSAITDRIKQWATIKQVAEFSGIQEVFDSRITAICWHHSTSQQNLVAVGIKDGSITIGKICLTTRKYKNVMEFDKIGKGNAIYSIKFDPNIDEVLYSACWNGTVTAKNIETSTSKLLLTKTYENQWFTTLDVSKDGEFLVSGCTNGLLHVFNKDGKKMFTGHIHSQRILSVELCPRDKNLLATSSLDKTVKLWDMRYIKDKSSYIMSLKHKSPPGTATFSLHGCNQLLTSDQSREIRVYSASNWKLLNVIGHPHRQFMHITPIKASWHPKSDVIVIGRYPDKTFEPYIENEPRTIDFFCPNTGKMLYQLLKPGITDKIPSLNIFNSTGNIMASGKGDVLVLWS